MQASLKQASLTSEVTSLKASLDASELGSLDRFSCRAAQCYKPADRAFILKHIREEWGSEEAFDTFVHTELRAVMVQSKAQYQRQMSTVAADSVDLLFGD